MDWSRRVVVPVLLAGIWAVSLFALVYPATAQAQGGGGGIHIVQSGEMLRDVAREAGTDVGTLVALNGLSNGDVIYVGQQLVLPGGSPNAGGWDQPSRQNDAGQNWQNDNAPSAQSWNQQPQQNNGNPGWAEESNQGQGFAYDPSASQHGGDGGQGQYASNPNDDWQWANSDGNSYRAGQSYDPSASQSSGNSEGPRGPYGPGPNSGEPANNNGYAPDDGWSPQQDQASQNRQNDDWGWTHEDNNSYSAGTSWEPSPNLPDNSSQVLTGEKWIDIDISEQQLIAYQGDTVVRSFIVSTGSASYPTVTGTYYTYARYDIQDMSGGSAAAGDYYFQPDVPWVQYFYEGFSIHGAYWHNQFGSPIGHGCINMRVNEAQWLYDWTATTGIRVVVHY